MDDRAFQLLREFADGGVCGLPIRGGCMEPRLADGARVAVRARAFYLPGDVLLVRTWGGTLVAHRLLGWRLDGLVTRGDHCASHDAAVPRSHVVGAVDTPVSAAERLRSVAHLLRIVWRKLRA